MPQFDEKHVKLCGGIVVWDGVTTPEISPQGTNAGKPKWTLKAVFEPHNMDVMLYDKLAQMALQQSKWRGTLPAGGRMPIGIAQANEFNGLFTGWPVISFKTSLRMPDIYDENGAVIDAFRLGQLLYPGQRVDVLAHCYEYDAAGNRGISAGMDAFAIIASANMQRLNIGSGVNTASAFGGGGPQGGAGAAQTTYQPQTYGSSQVNVGAVTQQAPQYNPNGGGAPAYNPNGGAPAYNPNGGTPSQAHNFLPQPPVKYRTPDGQEWTEEALLAARWPREAIMALPRV